MREEQLRTWQLAWDRATTGSVTRELVPSIRRKIIWSRNRSVDISYARMLLSSVNLNEDRYRMKLEESPNCECGEDRESIEHFLLHCKIFSAEREIILQAIMEVWFEKRSVGTLNVTKECLIGPNFSEKLNGSEDAKIKHALFVYLVSAKEL